MTDAPETRPSLLVRLRDPRDQRAWAQFVELYAPVVYGFARRQGLQDADAADLTQDVLCSVATAARRLEYDPRRGTFRGWFFTVARNRLRNFLTRRDPAAQGSGSTDVHELLSEQPVRAEEESWDQHWQEQLFAAAAREVQSCVEPATWQAFWLTAVEGRSSADVAKRLGMSVANVYRAKSRVLARLKDAVRQLEEQSAGS